MPKTTGYAEIADHLRRQIQDGILKPGDTMPSFKKVATQFGVAITTVNRAYRLLKSEGLTQAKPGAGTVVAAPASRGVDARAALDEPHTDLTDCIRLVAYSAWAAAWRQARNDQHLDPDIAGEVDHLIEQGDFLEMTLHRHNWRNVNAVLAAFRDAGLAGSSDVAAFYTHRNHIPDQRG
ncbi:GntR family transcriptional regulator [Streptomyces sp. NPDC008222]|uniref:GntR family transcriptional regulator n=1 Tax=Streptomyces sp. NPDC008222 TaxID=3364820 RepID=UPI0036EF89A1